MYGFKVSSVRKYMGETSSVSNYPSKVGLKPLKQTLYNYSRGIYNDLYQDNKEYRNLFSKRYDENTSEKSKSSNVGNKASCKSSFERIDSSFHQNMVRMIQRCDSEQTFQTSTLSNLKIEPAFGMDSYFSGESRKSYAPYQLLLRYFSEYIPHTNRPSWSNRNIRMRKLKAKKSKSESFANLRPGEEVNFISSEDLQSFRFKFKRN